MEITETNAWKAYVELRKKKQARAPFTDIARERILMKLKVFEAQGQSIEAMLYQSVENGWTGVFPVKGPVVGSNTVPSLDAEKSQAWIVEHTRPVDISAERRAEIAQQLRDTKAKFLRQRVSM